MKLVLFLLVALQATTGVFCRPSIEHSHLSHQGDCKAPDWFECHNKRCIVAAWMCDNENDCMDWSDEDYFLCKTNASTSTVTFEQAPCAKNEFHCAKGDSCIPALWVCDRQKDCPLGEDETEEECEGNLGSCIRDTQFTCSSGECISSSWKCDGSFDCDDGSDEAAELCFPETNSTTNQVFNIHASLPSTESAGSDDAGGDDRFSDVDPWEEDSTLVDFKIISFECPDCIHGEWRSIINVHGTPTNSSLMEFSCPGLVVKQPGFYVVLPIFPNLNPDPHYRPEPLQVLPKTKSWDGFLHSKPPATIWFDKGDEVNFRTLPANMDFVPGTVIRVQKI